jgi:general secretion pathway protein M
MNAVLRRSLSTLSFFAVVALLAVGAASTAIELRDEQASVASLSEQSRSLEARSHHLSARQKREVSASPFLDAPTITLAGATLQQRVETAVLAADGRLISSNVEVGGRGSERRVRLDAELTISQPGMQKLLYDLETGAPYLFVDSFEARAPERSDGEQPGAMHVSMALSGQWGGGK